MNKCTERVYNGIVKENPTFVLMLGMCPTLAVTTSAINGIGMGLSTTAVLIFSNLIIAALRKVIPDRVRIPAFIVIVASLVTIVQLLIEAYVPSLYTALGIYIPLIVVNCIILGRAESYASKNGAVLSAFDGIGMGIGFTVGLALIGVFREFLGSGNFFGMAIGPDKMTVMEYLGSGILGFQFQFEPISILVLAPGAFFVLAMLTALQNKFKAPSATNGSAPKSSLACGGNCMSCSGTSCKENREMLNINKTESKTVSKKKDE